MVVAERDLVVTPEKRVQEPTTEEMTLLFQELERELAALERHDDNHAEAPTLVAPGGAARLRIPPSVFQTLRFVVHHMSRGQAVALMPVNMRLTTQEAADLLGVSRPFLIKLLDRGEIAFTRTGKHRRVKLQDVLDYKERRDRAALDALTALAREAQEAGDYFG